MTANISVPNMFDQIKAMHGTNDEVVVKRMIAILEFCGKEEHTIEEICDEFGMHYQTIYKNVKTLLGMRALQVSPIRRGKKNLYVTNWAFTKNEGEELRWRSYQGDFTPVGEYVKRFLKVAPKRMSGVMEQTGKLLIANWCNKIRGEEGMRNYDEDFTKLMLADLEENITAVKAILYVMEQAVNAPFWEDEEGHKMYSVPVEREVAEEVLQEVWLELNELTP